MRQPPSTEQVPRRSFGLLLLRYGIGAVMVLAGLVMLIVDPSGLGAEGFAMAVGGGLSVLLINFLFRSASAATTSARRRSGRAPTSTSTASGRRSR